MYRRCVILQSLGFYRTSILNWTKQKSCIGPFNRDVQGKQECQTMLQGFMFLSLVSVFFCFGCIIVQALPLQGQDTQPVLKSRRAGHCPRCYSKYSRRASCYVIPQPIPGIRGWSDILVGLGMSHCSPPELRAKLASHTPWGLGLAVELGVGMLQETGAALPEEEASQKNIP